MWGALRSLRDRTALLLEVFVAANLAFLVLDVFLAHSVNEFRHPAEWVPFGFAALGSLALLANLFRAERFDTGIGGPLGLVVGSLGILVGVGGMVLHLESRFFQELTLRSLVYSAPFVAPLAFTGLGFLLLLNRMVDHGSRAWGAWIVFLAWAGFVGNFALSLADHAQNGFFHALEWIPVVMSALAVGYLLTVLVREVEPGFLRLGYWILGAQAVTGLLGFALHLAPTLEGPTAIPLIQRVIYGAPVFAPLLFTNLALLAGLGIWDLQGKIVD